MARKLRIEYAGAYYHVIDQKDTFVRKSVEAEASETREPRWKRGLSKALELLDRYLAPHRWIAARLKMGGAGSVQTLVSRYRRESDVRPKDIESSRYLTR